MEVIKLVDALEESILYLRNSQPSNRANLTIEEVIANLESELNKAKSSQTIDMKLLRILFAPTGVIQETSIDNGWGDEYLKISEIVHQFPNNG